MTPNLEAIATEIKMALWMDCNTQLDIQIHPANNGRETRLSVYLPAHEVVSYKDLQMLQRRLFTHTKLASIYVAATYAGTLRLSISTIGLKARYYEKES